MNPKPKLPTAQHDPFRWFDSSPEVIRLVVLMYVRFPLSLRNVEDLLFERGIDICHETVRLWWNQFEPMFAGEIRRRRVRRMRQLTHWKWRLDEMYAPYQRRDALPLAGRRPRRRGAGILCHQGAGQGRGAGVHQEGMKRHGRPKAIVTDGLRSHGAALTELGVGDRQEMGRWLNNRIEGSHVPIRRRERAMARFRRMKTLQKFTSVHASVHNHFNQERHLVDRQTYKQRRSAALAEWRSVMS
jgi:putative transposase